MQLLTFGHSPFIHSWTDQQRVAAGKEGWGYRLLYSARLVSIFLFWTGNGISESEYIGANLTG